MPARTAIIRRPAARVGPANRPNLSRSRITVISSEGSARRGLAEGGPATPRMAHIRYRLSIESCDTGTAAHLTFSLRTVVLLSGLSCVGLALLIMGARAGASAELAALRAKATILEQENTSYRAATGELTNQITSLQSVLGDLGSAPAVDGHVVDAIGKLPSAVRTRAIGGAAASEATRTLLSLMTSPDNTFGALRSVLGTLEDRLRTVRTDVQRWESLASATPSIWPAVGWLNDDFGYRSDPFTGQSAFHSGLDIGGDQGDPIVVSADGVVESAGWHNDYGNLVVVRHQYGLTSRYAHLSSITVKPGDRLARGDLIGKMGATGRASGTHLHYEVWANGRPIDPLSLLTARPQR